MSHRDRGLAKKGVCIFFRPLPDHPAILLAFDQGQTSLTGAPMTGRIIAALASGDRLNLDLEPYRVDRFD